MPFREPPQRFRAMGPKEYARRYLSTSFGSRFIMDFLTQQNWGSDTESSEALPPFLRQANDAYLRQQGSRYQRPTPITDRQQTSSFVERAMEYLEPLDGLSVPSSTEEDWGTESQTESMTSPPVKSTYRSFIRKHTNTG